MRYVWRTILLLVVFVGVGVLTSQVVVHCVANAGASESQVKLSAAMAGVTLGGAVTVILGIGLAMRKKKTGE